MTTASPLPAYASRSGRQFPARAGEQAGSSASSRSAAKPGTAVPPARQAQDQPEPSPAAPVLSTAAAPAAAARRVLAAKGGLPLYAGLGGLALVGIIDWPVALAAGTGYGLARFWARLDQQQQPVPARPAG